MRIKTILLISCLIISGLVSFLPSGYSDEPIADNWVIDGDTVYIDDSLVYASATPHTVMGSTWVTFDFRSKVFTGDVDFIWGFDVPNVRPMGVEIWRNYTHYYTDVHVVEKYGSIVLENVTEYTNLGIENYTSYAVTLGNENNTYLFNVSYDPEGNGTIQTGVYAFSSYDVDGNNYTLYGYYNASESYVYTIDFFDWNTWDAEFETLSFDYGGMNTWYLLSGVNIVMGVDYKIRARIQTPFSINGSSGKYWWAFKPSSETLSESIANSHLYALDPWWNSSWDYYKQITIDSIDQAPSTLTNFPILVNFTDADLASHANADGGDIAFVLTDNSTQLNHEIEKYVSATGELIAWVNVTSLPHDSDLQILMYYNNSGASNQTDTVNVWDSNYAMVQHFDETSGTVYDSTNNDLDGTATFDGTGTMTSTGVVGNCFYYDGTNDHIYLGDDKFESDNEGTISVWYKVGSPGSYTTFLASGSLADTSGREFAVGINSNDGGELIYDAYLTDCTQRDRLSVGSNLGDDVWRYSVWTSNGTDIHGYVDGTDSVITDTAGTSTGQWFNDICTGTHRVNIGRFQDGDTDQYHIGSLDEIRVSSVERSADWITTSYNTINNASTGCANPFISIGSEQSQSSPPSNNNPTQSGESPTNTTTGISLTPSLFVNCTDNDGDTMNATWWSNSSGSWVQFAGNETGFANNTNITQSFTNATSYSTLYYWSVNLSDGEGGWCNDTYHFTTKSNNVLVFSNPNPANNSIDNVVTFTWNITINDPDGHTFNWTIECSNGDTSSANDASNGSKTLAISGLAYSTQYTVWVNATDSYNWTNETFVFTTLVNSVPVFSNPNPANNSVGNNLSFTWNITIQDPDGHTFNWSIECSNGDTSSANDASNGSKTLSINSLTVNTTYTIWVNCTDSYNWTNESFSFTTINFAGGNGSVSNPFQIDKIEHLWNVRENLSANYSLIADLDFELDSDYVDSSHKTSNISGVGWRPIASSNVLYFDGIFKGNNYTINNLFINESSPSSIYNYTGLFGTVAYSSSNVSYLGVTNASITIGEVDGTGCLCGYLYQGNIFSCYSSGDISGNKVSGGLIGVGWDSYINSCYSITNISIIDGSAGGLVGWAIDNNYINNSYAMGTVHAGNQSGGLVGTCDGFVNNCFSNGSVSVDTSDVGGLIGLTNGVVVSDCFWDTETSGQASSDGGTGKTTAQMKMFDTFDSVGWDIDSDATDLNDGYPYLAWQNDTSGYVWLIAGSPPSTPAGTINTTTAITGSTSTLNGYLNDDGNDSDGCWVRFQYCLNNTNFDSEGTNTSWQTDKISGTVIDQAIGSLPEGSLHYVRMQMNNSNGWYNTSNTSFLTKPSSVYCVPSYYNNFNGTLRIATDHDNVNIVWPYLNRNYTIVRYATDTFPNSPIDGIEIYNDTMGTNSEGLLILNTSIVPYDTTIYLSLWTVINWSSPNHFQESDVEHGMIHTPIEHKNRVLTDDVTNVENDSVTFNLNLSEDGGLDNWVNFEYSTDDSYSSNTTNLTGKTEGVHSQSIMGITPGQFYFVRARANNTNSSSRSTDSYKRWIFSGFNLVYFPEYVFNYNNTIEDNPSGDNIFGSISGTLAVYYYNGTSDAFDVYNPDTSDSINPFVYSTDYLASTNTEQNVTINLDEVVFLMRPTNTSSISNSSGPNWINVSWTSGSGANASVVVRKEGSYPSSPSDGTEVYNGTLSYYNDTGISGTYYYRVWSWANWSNEGTEYNKFSSGYSDAEATASNSLPVFSNENPSNNSIDVAITQATVNVTIEDTDVHTFNWTIEVSNGDNSNATGASNGSKSCALTTPLAYNTVFTWWVNCTDSYSWTNASYVFTTRSQYVPAPPSGFSATAVNRTVIDLAWTNNGSNNTIIEWNTSESWAMGDGTELDNSTNTTYVHSGLSFGTQYFYQAWSYNSTDKFIVLRTVVIMLQLVVILLQHLVTLTLVITLWIRH